jgi:hypothetical protein
VETFVKWMAPSVVCVAPCHPPVLRRTDAVQAESPEAEGPSTGSPTDEEQAARKSPLRMHDRIMDRRTTSKG